MPKKKKRKNSNYQTKLQGNIELKNADAQDRDYTPGPKQKYDKAQLDLMGAPLHFTPEQMKRLANLTAKYPGLNLFDITRIASKLTAQYNDALVEKDRALDTADLLKHDMIDLTDMSDEELDEYVTTTVRRKFEQDENAQFYFLLPCFQEGTVMHKKSRIIYYKMLDLNVEEKSFTIFLQDYTNVETEHEEITWVNGKYISGIYGTCKLSLMPGKTNLDEVYDQHCTLEILSSRTFPEIYREISAKQLGWNDLRAQIWKLMVLQNSDNVDMKQKAQNIIPLVNLMHIFVTQIITANCAMAAHRTKILDSENGPSPAPDKNDEAGKSRTTRTDHTAKKQPERIVHHVGRIRIISRTKPKRVTKSGIRNYRVSEWTRRAHIRHLASGKTVYIKPSTYHRRAKPADGMDAGRTPTTIKIHKEEPEYDD